MKRPAFQFYPADWRKDPALSTCSLAARGLWLEMMCIAHESDVYGHLCIAGNPMTVQQISRGVGESPAVVGKLIDELEKSGVFSRDEKGSIFSRRMVRDERIRNVRADAGRLGGNPNLLAGKVKQNDKQKPTPSSSSSSSSSTSENTALPPSTAEGGGVDGVNGATEGFTPTPAGAVCKALRQAGVPDTNPGHPRLLALLDAGARPEEFLAFVASATDGTKGSPFAYLLGAVEGERKRAAKTSQELHHGAMPAAAGGDRKARQLATAAVLTGASPAPKPQPETIDVHARIVAP